MDNKTIMLVDDDQRNIFALSAVLKSRNFKILPVSEMNTAINILKDGQKTDLVLLDMMIPGIDGYEGLAIIRSHPELMNLPVIAVTAQAMQGDKEKCLAAGASDYISKPVDISVLERLLQKHLS